MIRQQGIVGSAAGLIPFGHLGWGYRDRADFLARAAEYLADGLAQNQWVEYVGAGSRDELQAELTTLPGIGRDNDIKVTPTRKFYAVPDGGDIIDPDLSVAKHVAAVENALAQGYTGFRTISDVTTVARRPEQRNALARFEFLIDQQMAVLPFSAFCAYNTAELAGHAGALLCLHPLIGGCFPMFRLFAQPGTSFALTGEIDTASDETFTAALHHIWPLLTEDKMIIDARRLEYIGHQQLLTLDDLARADGRQVVLRTGQPIPIRLVDLLGLTHVRAELPDDCDDDAEDR